MEKILWIVRGIPGCGKSTVAIELAKGYDNEKIICCADDYHMVNGEYKWSLEKQGFAHKSCQTKCETLMTNNSQRIIVANTSTTLKEMKPYTALAEKYGYTVFSIIVENRHDGKDVHNVPEISLSAMTERFDIKLR